MPIMNGDEVCKTTKNLILEKKLPDIMIIISSANNSNEDN
jgi:CheY-like chemotaxis protein